MQGLYKNWHLFASSSFVLILVLTLYQPCLGQHTSYSQPSSTAYNGLYPQDAYQEEYEHGSNDYSNYNPYHDQRVVHSKGRYTLEWTLDYKAKIITFNMTVRTTGWVGIGLSKNGAMSNADILIGWIGVNAQGYILDLHSDDNRKLITDSKQSWKLLAASESNGITHLLVNRPLDTCDPYDLPITTDLIWVLWAYGEKDDLEYHFDKRGSFRAYLTDPVLKSPEPNLNSFRLSNEFTLAEHTTSYICSIHKGPHELQKQHMVEFHPFFENTLPKEHTHHIIVWRCVAPPGMNAKDIFEPLLGFPGEECYFSNDHIIPVNLCRMIVTIWAIGGNPYILPYSTGIPSGESFDEYYMLEVHFNNPEALPLQGGNIMIAYDAFGLFMVPPISPSFEVYAFCTQNCIQSMISDSGFEIVAGELHTHISGTKVKLQHFRNGKELEWIFKDDNYDSTFQQYRILYEPRLVLPGDLLALKCEYDNTWTNVTTVTGFSTREEMCIATLTISKRIPYFVCGSQVPAQNLLSLIGVEDFEWVVDTQDRIITAPPALAGKHLSYVTDTLTDWTKSLRYKLQEVQLSSLSTEMCPKALIPVPTSTHQSHHHHSDQQTHADNRKTVAHEQKILGTIISSSADPADILDLAKGYGETTIMGENRQLPTKMPTNIVSSAGYPYGAERYQPIRTCPRVITQSIPYYSTQNNYAAIAAYGGAGGYQSYISAG